MIFLGGLFFFLLFWGGLRTLPLSLPRPFLYWILVFMGAFLPLWILGLYEILGHREILFGSY